MSNAKILLIDDDAVGLKAISALLINAGYEVDAASDSKIAWGHLLDGPKHYAAVLTDRMMLGLDAMELLHRVKQSPALCHIPVIVITGEATPEEEAAALTAGAFAFLYKPVTQETLLQVVTAAL